MPPRERVPYLVGPLPSSTVVLSISVLPEVAHAFYPRHGFPYGTVYFCMNDGLSIHPEAVADIFSFYYHANT